MPELPEVEITVRGLTPALLDRRIARVEVRRARMRRPFPSGLAERLTGARVTALGRRGKYGTISTDRGDSIVFHLGMSGRWRIDPVEIGRHDHLVLETAESGVLSLNDPRRFGFVDVTATDRLAAYAPFAAMGPEPLGDGFHAADLGERLRGRTGAVKAALLDQRVVAGLGNIYVCEALHMAGVEPATPAGVVPGAKLSLLVDSVRAVLNAAIAAGGSTIRDYARPDGELGYFARQWRVYGREGEACGCGGVVVRRAEGGRSTFLCPACQPPVGKARVRGR